MTRIAITALGVAICLSHCAGPARADTVEDALSVVCPGHEDLAPLVVAAAHRQLEHPVTIIALIKSESPRCDANVVNPKTYAVGLTQILPTGSANPRHLSIEKLKDPETNINLGARHLAGLLTMCGSLGAAVHVYHGHRTCSGWRHDRHARKVLGIVARIWRELAKRREPRS